MGERKEAFFIVWSPEGSSPPRARHFSFEQAASEAKRLALAHPGRDFFVMQAARRVSTPKIEIEDFDVGVEVPF